MGEGSNYYEIKSQTHQEVDPQWKIIVSQRFSHRSENSELCVRLLSLGFWRQEEEPREHLSFKARV